MREQALRELVAAVDDYLASKGGSDAMWMASFNRLMMALQAAKAALVTQEPS